MFHIREVKVCSTSRTPIKDAMIKVSYTRGYSFFKRNYIRHYRGSNYTWHTSFFNKTAPSAIDPYLVDAYKALVQQEWENN